jgi:hypothetical protein
MADKSLWETDEDIFRRMVVDECDMAGIVSYGLYKFYVLEAIKDAAEKSGGQLTNVEMCNTLQLRASAHDLKILKDTAEGSLFRFADEFMRAVSESDGDKKISSSTVWQSIQIKPTFAGVGIDIKALIEALGRLFKRS